MAITDDNRESVEPNDSYQWQFVVGDTLCPVFVDCEEKSSGPAGLKAYDSVRAASKVIFSQ